MTSHSGASPSGPSSPTKNGITTFARTSSSHSVPPSFFRSSLNLSMLAITNDDRHSVKIDSKDADNMFLILDVGLPMALRNVCSSYSKMLTGSLFSPTSEQANPITSLSASCSVTSTTATAPSAVVTGLQRADSIQSSSRTDSFASLAETVIENSANKMDVSGSGAGLFAAAIESDGSSAMNGIITRPASASGIITRAKASVLIPGSPARQKLTEKQPLLKERPNYLQLNGVDGMLTKVSCSSRVCEPSNKAEGRNGLSPVNCNGLCLTRQIGALPAVKTFRKGGFI